MKKSNLNTKELEIIAAWKELTIAIDNAFNSSGKSVKTTIDWELTKISDQKEIIFWNKVKNYNYKKTKLSSLCKTALIDYIHSNINLLQMRKSKGKSYDRDVINHCSKRMEKYCKSNRKMQKLLDSLMS